MVLAFKILIFTLSCITIAAYLSLFERKLIGRIQLRIGPNNCGIFGICQPIADALKLFFKRDSLKNHSNQSIFGVCLLFFTSIVQLSLIPISRDFYILNTKYGLLYVIFIHSVIIFSEVLIGTSSKSKYGVIGGIRSYIQTLGSHIPFILAIIIIILTTRTLNLNEISTLNYNYASFLKLIPIFMTFFITSLVLTSHTPFDFPEAESELVGGVYVEYGGVLFAMIYLSDYLNLIFITALTATLFLGGYELPFIIGPFALFIKTMLLISLIILIRAMLPRYRQDQMITISWTVLIPILFIYIFILL